VPLRRAKVDIPAFMDAAARGSWWRRRSAGWATTSTRSSSAAPPACHGPFRSARARPTGYLQYATFQPTFLYELIWDLLLAAALVWLIKHRRIRAPGIFALYVTGYSAFRIFEEKLRVDPAHHSRPAAELLVACLLTIIGGAWFMRTQRPAPRRTASPPTSPMRAAGGVLAPGLRSCEADGPG